MSTEDCLIEANKNIKQAMRRMSQFGVKQLFVVAREKELLGALSDGDIRKWILKGGKLTDAIDRIYNRTPKTVGPDFELEDVRKLMLSLKIEAVPVVSKDGKVADILIWDVVFGGKKKRQLKPMNLPVVIMAGGKGTRLDPFTKILPKPLIPIGDKPIIEHIIDKFAEAGAKDFYLSINHKAKMIRAYFEESRGRNILHYIEEKEPLGTAGSLRLLKGKVDGTFFVTNCDTIIDADYSEMLHFHEEHKFDMTIIASFKQHVIPYGVCVVNKDGSLKTIDEKPEHDLLINTGMYIMESRLLSLIPSGPISATELMERAKKKGFRVGVFPVSERSWIDVGQWEEYQKAIRHFKVVAGGE